MPRFEVKIDLHHEEVFEDCETAEQADTRARLMAMELAEDADITVAEVS